VFSSACGLGSLGGDAYFTSPAWMDDGWVYLIAKRNEAPSVLMRQKQDVDAEPADFSPTGCPSPEATALVRAAYNVLVAAVYCRDQPGTFLFAMNVSTRSVEELGWVADDEIVDMAWAPDLRRAYVVDDSCLAVVMITVDGGSVARSVWPNPDAPWRRESPGGPCRPIDAHNPVVAGAFVYVDVFEPESTNIVRIPVPDGPPMLVTDEFTAVIDLAATPDGQGLVVSGERGNRSCWVIDLVTGQMTDLELSAASEISVSPSGEQLAITTSQGLVFQDM
jgi:hypothetical protein